MFWYSLVLVITVPVVLLEPSLHVHAKTKPKAKAKTKNQPGDSASAVTQPTDFNHGDAQNYGHSKAQTGKAATTATTSQPADSTSKRAALSIPAPLSIHVDTVKSTEAVLQGTMILI